MLAAIAEHDGSRGSPAPARRRDARLAAAAPAAQPTPTGPMSQAESPQRSAPTHAVTIEDVRQLMGASTPHFALQLRNRIAKLIAPLAADDPARLLGEAEIARLGELAVAGETRGDDEQDDLRAMPSLGA
jgi:hypothetical protein